MRVKSAILLLASCLIVISSALGTPQFEKKLWKQKVLLLQSTRADVEKIFGKPIGENYGVTYKLKDGILYLDYYDFDHCKSQDGFHAALIVLEWTVTEIEF